MIGGRRTVMRVSKEEVSGATMKRENMQIQVHTNGRTRSKK